MHNLIEQVNYYCEPDYRIGLFGAFFLGGIVIGSVSLTRMGDIYGRKPIFLVGVIMQIFITAAFLFVKSG